MRMQPSPRRGHRRREGKSRSRRRTLPIREASRAEAHTEDCGKPTPPLAKPATPVAAKRPRSLRHRPQPASKPDPASSMRVRTLDLTFSDPPRRLAKERAPSGRAVPCRQGVEFKDAGIRLEAELANRPRSRGARRCTDAGQALRPKAATCEAGRCSEACSAEADGCARHAAAEPHHRRDRTSRRPSSTARRRFAR
jgi:hypothetical protein